MRFQRFDAEHHPEVFMSSMNITNDPSKAFKNSCPTSPRWILRRWSCEGWWFRINPEGQPVRQQKFVHSDERKMGVYFKDLKGEMCHLSLVAMFVWPYFCLAWSIIYNNKSGKIQVREFSVILWTSNCLLLRNQHFKCNNRPEGVVSLYLVDWSHCLNPQWCPVLPGFDVCLFPLSEFRIPTKSHTHSKRIPLCQFQCLVLARCYH